MVTNVYVRKDPTAAHEGPRLSHRRQRIFDYSEIVVDAGGELRESQTGSQGRWSG